MPPSIPALALGAGAGFAVGGPIGAAVGGLAAYLLSQSKAAPPAVVTVTMAPNTPLPVLEAIDAAVRTGDTTKIAQQRTLAVTGGDPWLQGTAVASVGNSNKYAWLTDPTDPGYGVGRHVPNSVAAAMFDSDNQEPGWMPGLKAIGMVVAAAATAGIGGAVVATASTIAQNEVKDAAFDMGPSGAAAVQQAKDGSKQLYMPGGQGNGYVEVGGAFGVKQAQTATQNEAQYRAAQQAQNNRIATGRQLQGYQPPRIRLLTHADMAKLHQDRSKGLAGISPRMVVFKRSTK